MSSPPRRHRNRSIPGRWFDRPTCCRAEIADCSSLSGAWRWRFDPFGRADRPIPNRARPVESRTVSSASPTRWRCGKRDRGAAVVEAAFATPLLFLVVFAAMELSLLAHQRLALADAVSSSVRTASAAANAADSDFRILGALKSRLGGVDKDDITSIVVFRAPSTSATPANDPGLAACRSASVVGVCNHYDADDLDLPSTSFGCGVGSVDSAWCPSGRVAVVSGPPDLVGVEVVIDYEAATAALGQSYTLRRSQVLRIEPQEWE